MEHKEFTDEQLDSLFDKLAPLMFSDTESTYPNELPGVPA